MIIMAELAPNWIFEDDTEYFVAAPEPPKRRSFYDFDCNYEENFA